MKLPDSGIRGVYFRDRAAWIRFAGPKGPDGKRELIRENTYQTSKQVAKKILEKRKTEVALGVHFPTPPTEPFANTMFAELEQRWWGESGKRATTSWRYLWPRIKRFFGGMRIREVTTARINEFLDGLSVEGYAPSYVNSYRTYLSAMFTYCLRQQPPLYDRNPAGDVKQLRETPRARIVSMDEWNRLRPELEKDEELHAFAITAVLTACRKSEILQRRWIEVDLESDFPAMKIPITKNGDLKIVPLAPASV